MRSYSIQMVNQAPSFAAFKQSPPFRSPWASPGNTIKSRPTIVPWRTRSLMAASMVLTTLYSPDAHSSPDKIPKQITTSTDAPRPIQSDAYRSPSDSETYPRRSKSMRAIKHQGFVVDVQAGSLGCTRSTCLNSDRMNSGAGFSINGFVGGNIRGWVELGLSGGWGMLTPRPINNSFLLDLYGLEDLSRQMEEEFMITNLSRLTIDQAKSNNLFAGPSLRIHALPMGPVAVFAGAGVAYDLYRSNFSSPNGAIDVNFHGISIPIEGGINIHLNKHLAISAKFNYLWTYFALLVAEQPQQFQHRLIAPVALIDAAREPAQPGLAQSLPHFWTASAGIRLTL